MTSTLVTLIAREAGALLLEHAFDRAAASPWESAWERVVQDAAKKLTFSNDEIGWLLGRAVAANGAGYRFAETLARVLGLVAERHEAYGPLVAFALAALFRHELPSVRIATLEAMLEVNVKSAKILARRVGADAHPSLREAADAVLAMTG